MKLCVADGMTLPSCAVQNAPAQCLTVVQPPSFTRVARFSPHSVAFHSVSTLQCDITGPMPYCLHHAPDNASLIIRLALEEMCVPYHTQLVDRRRGGQKSPEYLKLNPNGLIPTLETPDGPIFETGAILLWLADRHGKLFPAVSDPARGAALSWLFFLANTVHPALRMLFYPATYTGSDPGSLGALRDMTRSTLLRHFTTLERNWTKAPDTPTISDFYLAALLRWVQFYPINEDKSWFDLNAFPRLLALVRWLETRDCTAAVQAAEGLGPTPFSAPHAPNPPEGSAT